MKGLILVAGIASLAVLGWKGVLSHAEQYLEAVQHPNK
jgi:hypothetical protein